MKVSNSINQTHSLLFSRRAAVRDFCVLIFLFFSLMAFPGSRKGQEHTLRETINSAGGLVKIAVTPTSHQELAELYESYEYGWDTVGKGIPPLALTALPHNLSQIPDLVEKKQVFFLAILPIALMANQKIQLQRKNLLHLFEKVDRGETLSHHEGNFLMATLQYYKLYGNLFNGLKTRRELLKRVDIVPPALTLAQAASESAYGTSRFSQLGNNLFGEWTFTPGTGIVPKDRPDGKTYEVRRFKSISASVNAYLKNLNTHRAYKELREKRAFLRSKGLPLKSTTLADGLIRYSIRGEEYVKSLKKIIRQNRLSRLSQVKFRVPASSTLFLGSS